MERREKAEERRRENVYKDALRQLKAKTTIRKGRGVIARPRGLNEDRRIEFEAQDSESHGNHQRSAEGYAVLVTGIHEECQEDVLMDKFSEYGLVKSIDMPLDRKTGYVKGYALVIFESYREAQASIKEMDGEKLYSKKLGCNFAFQTI